MSFYSSKNYEVLSLKLQDLFKTNENRITKEYIIYLLTNLLFAQENPAFYASMIVALKRSGRLDDIVNEFNNPSFEIPGVENIPYDDIPAKFTANYQLSDEFIDNNKDEYKEDINKTFATPLKCLTVRHVNKPFARIVLIS